MKDHNIIVYLIIPLALLSIMSLLENVQAQTNSSSSTNQKTSTTTAKSKHKSYCSVINENRYS